MNALTKIGNDTHLSLEQIWEERSKALGQRYPTVSLQALEMPPPGPNFIDYATRLSDQPNKAVQNLYNLALYEPWFAMDVYIKGKPKMVRFIPGHTWGAQRAEGPVDRAKVMVIGKMPGIDDERAGRNLLGRAGQILIEALELAECQDFYGWYVTNLMKFGHPMPEKGRALSREWIKDCLPLLHSEFRLVLPDYILCLGSEAGKEVLGLQGSVNNSVGRVFDYKIPLDTEGQTKTEYKTVKVMTCIHPAAVAISPDLKPQLFSTIQLFTKLVNGEKVGREEKDIDHVVIKTDEELLALKKRVLEETKFGGAIAVDCEWEGEYPAEKGSYLRTIQISHKPKFAACLVYHERGGAVSKLSRRLVASVLNEIFESTPERHVRAVGHFYRADLPWLKYIGVDLGKAFEAPVDQKIGWSQTKSFGGFDTGMAAHSVCETDDYKLEVLATRYTSVPRYDISLQEAKKELCKVKKIKADDLEGYGEIPDEILYPYANYDVDATRRLFDVFNGEEHKTGLLDLDEFKNNCRMAFWISMRASPACAEMEDVGLCVSMARAEKLTEAYRKARDQKLALLRSIIGWASFNPKSQFDCRELLFGVKHRGQISKDGKLRRASPPEAKLLNLGPVKASGKVSKKSWQELERTKQADKFTPSADREVLGILYHTYPDLPAIGLLREFRFVNQLLQTTLKPPIADRNGTIPLDEDGNPIYEKGLLSFVCKDARIRTHIYQTLETGRYSSARPCLQNISKRRESEYKRILGKEYLYSLRSIFTAPPGHVLIEADYVGAELAGMAWMSGDPIMIEHVRRAQLPENHPDFYDIHSNIAVTAFRLNCPPTKDGLKSIGMTHLRVAAKNVVFGYAYGRGAEAIARQAKEEGVDLTVEEAQALINGLQSTYRYLPEYFAACRSRVHIPGWLCNCFGRFRRFRPTDDRKVVGELERQSMNFPKMIGEVKRGELTESQLSCNTGNCEPSIWSDPYEGATTRSQVLCRQ